MKKSLAILLSIVMTIMLIVPVAVSPFTSSADAVNENEYADIVKIQNKSGTAQVLACTRVNGSITVKVKLGAEDYLQFANPVTDLIDNPGALQINLENHEFGEVPGAGDTTLQDVYYNCDFRVALTENSDYTNTGYNARWVFSGPGAGYADVSTTNPYIICSANKMNAYRYIALRNSVLSRGVALSLHFIKDTAKGNKIRLDTTDGDNNTGEDDENLSAYAPAAGTKMYVRLISNKEQIYNIRLNSADIKIAYSKYLKLYNKTGTAEVLACDCKGNSITVKVRLGDDDYIQFAGPVTDLIDNPGALQISVGDHEFGTVPDEADWDALKAAYGSSNLRVALSEDADYTAAFKTRWIIQGNPNASYRAMMCYSIDRGYNASSYIATFDWGDDYILKRDIGMSLTFAKDTETGYIRLDSEYTDTATPASKLSKYAPADKKPLYVRFVSADKNGQVYNIRLNSADIPYNFASDMVELNNLDGKGATSGAEILSCVHGDGYVSVKAKLGMDDVLQFADPITDLIDNPGALQISLDKHDFGVTPGNDEALKTLYKSTSHRVALTENPTDFSNNKIKVRWALDGNNGNQVNCYAIGSGSSGTYFALVDHILARDVAMSLTFTRVTESSNKIRLDSEYDDYTAPANKLSNYAPADDTPIYVRFVSNRGDKVGGTVIVNVRLYSARYALPDADYTAVDTAKNRWENIAYKGMYTPETQAAVQSAIDAVVTGKKVNEQATVTKYAAAINAAIDACEVDTDPFKYASLTLTNNLRYNFYISKAFVDALSDPAVTFASQVLTYGEPIEATQAGTVTIEGVSYYAYSFSDIGPDRMTADITASISGTYDGGTEYTSNPYTRTVRQYIVAALQRTKETDTALRALLVDLLNYGAQSQLYAGYQVGNLVNVVGDGLTEKMLDWGTADVQKPDNNRSLGDGDYAAKWSSVSLNLKDTVGIKYTLTPGTANVTSVKLTDAAGNTLATIDASKFTNGANGKKVILFNGLTAIQMDKVVKAVAYDGDTQVSKELSYSIGSYANSKWEDTTYPHLADLVKAMTKYGNSATAYHGLSN